MTPFFRSSFIVLTAMTLAALRAAEPPVGAASDEDDEAVIAEVVRNEMAEGIAAALDALRGDDLSSDQRRRAFRDVLLKRIDFRTVSRLAIGPLWRDLSEEHREEFTEQFTTHLLGIGAEAVRQYRGEDVIIIGDRRASRTDWIVETQIVRPRRREGGEAAHPLVKVDFRLRHREDEWRIIDVRIAGVSMAAGFRSQFDAVMRRGGIDHVIEILRERNAGRRDANEEPHNPA